MDLESKLNYGSTTDPKPVSLDQSQQQINAGSGESGDYRRPQHVVPEGKGEKTVAPGLDYYTQNLAPDIGMFGQKGMFSPGAGDTTERMRTEPDEVGGDFKISVDIKTKLNHLNIDKAESSRSR